MTLDKALEIINANQHLLGKKIKGATLDLLIPIPVDDYEADNYIREFLQSMSLQRALTIPHADDYKIIGIFDKHRVKTDGVLIRMDFSEIEKK